MRNQTSVRLDSSNAILCLYKEFSVIMLRHSSMMMKYIYTAADIEELLKEMVALDEHVPMKSRCQSLRERMTGTNAVYAVSCDAQGR